MQSGLRMLAFWGALGFALIALNGRPALAADEPIKNLMADNFGRVQKILIELVTGHYVDVPKDVDAITRHAADLAKKIPAAAKDNKELFLSMAYSLQVHASNLSTIAAALVERDKETKGGEMLKVDYLRNSAAAHFGQMVTACVACHNQFRRKMVKMK